MAKLKIHDGVMMGRGGSSEMIRVFAPPWYALHRWCWWFLFGRRRGLTFKVGQGPDEQELRAVFVERGRP